MKVNAWMSNVNDSDSGMNLTLSRQEDAEFSEHFRESDYIINIDETKCRQTIDGFGASMTDASAWLMYLHLRKELKRPDAYRELILKIFNKENGIGLSMLRQPIGASDYSLKWYTYVDKINPEMEHFSIDYDLQYIIPCLKDALQTDNNRIKIIASPWSPPEWMKLNGEFNPEYYEALAKYFVNYILAYQQQSISIWAVTPQNEPGYTTTDYPTMKMNAKVQAEFIGGYLGPAFEKNKLGCRIICYDHNWNDPGPEYIKEIYSNRQAYRYTAGCAWHWYSKDYTVAGEIRDQYPDKGMWLTEGSSGEWDPCRQWRDGFANQMVSQINYLRLGCKSIIFWNIALDENRGPNLIDNACRGLVMVNSKSGDITYNTDYYAMGHFSKFVDPAAICISSNEYSREIKTVAFQNTDGSKVLVVYNITKEMKNLQIKWHNKAFEYHIPGETAATFKWE